MSRSKVFRRSKPTRPPIPALSGSTFPAADCAGWPPVLQGGTHRALSAMLRAAGSGPAELDLVLGPRCGHGGLQPAVHGLPRPHQYLIFSHRRADRGRRTKTSPSSSGASSFPSTPCTGKRSCTGKIRRSIASGFWPTGSGIWPVTTTALKWMNCVPKCCLRQRLG